MSLEKLFGKRTWLGLAAELALLLAWVAVGALLVTGGVLPVTLREPWMLAGCLLSSLLGGALAVRGGGERLCGLLPALLLYGLLWVAALASSAPLDFQARGLKLTACILGGGLLAALPRRKGRRRRRPKRQGAPSRRR